MNEKGNILRGTDMRRRRKQLRIRLDELADELGTTPGVIANMERGITQRPNLVLVRRIEQRLGVEKGSFFD